MQLHLTPGPTLATLPSPFVTGKVNEYYRPGDTNDFVMADIGEDFHTPSHFMSIPDNAIQDWTIFNEFYATTDLTADAGTLPTTADTLIISIEQASVTAGQEGIEQHVVLYAGDDTATALFTGNVNILQDSGVYSGVITAAVFKRDDNPGLPITLPRTSAVVLTAENRNMVDDRRPIVGVRLAPVNGGGTWGDYGAYVHGIELFDIVEEEWADWDGNGDNPNGGSFSAITDGNPNTSVHFNANANGRSYRREPIDAVTSSPTGFRIRKWRSSDTSYMRVDHVKIWVKYEGDTDYTMLTPTVWGLSWDGEWSHPISFTAMRDFLNFNMYDKKGKYNYSGLRPNYIKNEIGEITTSENHVAELNNFGELSTHDFAVSQFAWVDDASDDPNVEAGGALYWHDNAAGTNTLFFLEVPVNVLEQGDW